MSKKKIVIAKEANRFKSVEELIKSFEEYSGFSIEPEEVDTPDKLLSKISEIQDFLTFEVTDHCSKYYREATKIIYENEKVKD